MSIHEELKAGWPVLPYDLDGLRGECLKPFASFSLHSIPWQRGQLKNFPAYELVKQSRSRRVIRLEWAGNGAVQKPLPIYVKRVEPFRLRSLVLSLALQSKVKGEWTLGRRMLEAGIPTPLPLLYAERRRCGIMAEGYLATLGLAQSSSFYRRFLALESAGERSASLQALARFVRSCQDKGFHHDDCSLHHVYVEDAPLPPGDRGRMWFIDVDNGRLGAPPSEAERVKSCFQMFRSLPEDCLSRGEQAEFLRTYFDRALSSREVEDYLSTLETWRAWKVQRKKFIRLARRIRGR